MKIYQLSVSYDYKIYSLCVARWSDTEPNTNLSKYIFLFTFKSIFHSSYYRQIFGTPMGGIISPIVAYIVMNELGINCLDSIKKDMPLCARYVDDTLIILRNDVINLILATFNNFHPKLQFTN